MHVFKLALGLAVLCSVIGCSATGSSSAKDLTHRIPLEGAPGVLFSSSAMRTDEEGLYLERVRFEVGDEAAGITELELILFDDLDGDGLKQAAEERARTWAKLGSPSRFVEFVAFRGQGPIGRPMLWARVVTGQGEATDSWSVDG